MKDKADKSDLEGLGKSDFGESIFCFSLHGCYNL